MDFAILSPTPAVGEGRHTSAAAEESCGPIVEAQAGMSTLFKAHGWPGIQSGVRISVFVPDV
jgi:hypothetical protein